MQHLNITYASEEFTTFTRKGGFIALANYINSIDFFNNFSQLNLSMKKRKYSTISKLQTIIASILVNCEYGYEINSKLRADKVSANAFGLEEFPEQSTIARFFHKFRKSHILQLQNIHLDVFKKHSLTNTINDNLPIVTDFDTTGIVVYGKTYQFARKGYFPRARGEKGYQVNVAYLGDSTHEVIANFVDPGNKYSNFRFYDLYKQTKKTFPDKKLLVRADAAFGTTKIVKFLSRKKELFLIRGNDPRTAKRVIKQVPEETWVKVNKTTWVSEADKPQIARDKKPPKDMRMILIRTQETNKSFLYWYFITNLPKKENSPQYILKLYNKRQSIEAFFKKSKNILHLSHVRTRKYSGIKAFISLFFIAYNLLLWFQKTVIHDLNIVGQKLKEFIREIIDSPAIVQYHENKLHLIFLARSKILDSIRLTYNNHSISHFNGASSC